MDSKCRTLLHSPTNISLVLYGLVFWCDVLLWNLPQPRLVQPWVPPCAGAAEQFVEDLLSFRSDAHTADLEVHRADDLQRELVGDLVRAARLEGADYYMKTRLQYGTLQELGCIISLAWKTAF